jgi:hypothetical protein
MWHPESHVSWNQVLSTLRNSVEEVLTEVCLADEQRPDGVSPPRYLTAQHYLVKRGFAKDYRQAELIVTIVTVYLLVNFLEEYPPVVASLSGGRISLERTFYCHRDRIDECSFAWPVTTDPQFSSLFEYSVSNGFSGSDLLDRFPFINGQTGQIQVKNGAKEHLINSWLTAQSVDLMLETANQLRGSVVCWPNFPDHQTYRDFLSCLEIDPVITDALDLTHGQPPTTKIDTTPQKPFGRPSQRDSLVAAYHEHFPLGHESSGKSWKEVTAVLNIGRKPQVSVWTVQRAVKGMTDIKVQNVQN